jgi:exodeoxyribonuclease VII small subunit
MMTPLEGGARENDMTTGKKTRKTEASREPGFEEAIGKLEAIVRELEGSDIPLEKALSLFEEGVRLSKVCHRKLSEAEKKVQVLARNEEGELEPRPFEPDGEEAEQEAGGEDGAGEDDGDEEKDHETDTLF